MTEPDGRALAAEHGNNQSRKPRWYPRGAWLWGSAVLFIVVGALAMWALPGWLLNVWVPSGKSADKRLLLGTATQIVLLGLGGVIAVVGVALSIARHGQELESSRRDERRHALEVEKEVARRDETRTQQRFESDREAQRSGDLVIQRRIDAERELRSRFVSAVELLSTPTAIKRTAGLYALAALADDWAAHGRTDEVQVCIDVLCGYLRAEASRNPEEAGVRRAGYDLIRSHLRGEDVRWSGRTFNLRSAPIWFDVDLSEIQCVDGTRLLLDGASIRNGAIVAFHRSRVGVNAVISLADTEIQEKCIVHLVRSVIRDGGVFSLNKARFAEGAVLTFGELEVLDKGVFDLFGVEAPDRVSLVGSAMILEGGGQVRMQQSRLGPGTILDLGTATIRDSGELLLGWSAFADGAGIRLEGVQVDGGRVDLNNATVEAGARILLDDARLSTPRSLVLSDLRVNDRGGFSIDGARIVDDAVIPPDFFKRAS